MAFTTAAARSCCPSDEGWTNRILKLFCTTTPDLPVPRSLLRSNNLRAVPEPQVISHAGFRRTRNCGHGREPAREEQCGAETDERGDAEDDHREGVRMVSVPEVRD